MTLRNILKILDMDFTLKKINKDWESADQRFRYRKGDEVMVLKENDQYHTVALDVGIIGCIPNECFEDNNIRMEEKIREMLAKEMGKHKKEMICLWFENIREMASKPVDDKDDLLANIAVKAKDSIEFIDKFWGNPEAWED